ncbi:MAG: type II secretion system F family protein [Actinobacteria bacterium]|nr:type II secretion system F family protein [Actinomycetota bacterium]
MSDVSTTDLLRVRAALSVGMPPAESLRSATDATLQATARVVGLGQPLAAVAREHADPSALSAGPLLRALALAQRCGHGAVDAIDLVLRTRHDALVDHHRLRARAAQATGTARLLTLLPAFAWGLMMAVDPAALRFYLQPVGMACAAVTVVLGVAAHVWSRRLVRRAAHAGLLADPLVAAVAAFDRGRALAVAAPVLIAGTVAIHPLVGLVAAGAAGAWAGRPREPSQPPSCGALEIVALLRMLLGAGTALPGALAHLADVTGDPVADQLRLIARRLRAGTGIERAFVGTGLVEIGSVLAITEQWGVSAAPSLHQLGEALRARQRAAAETAAERVQLALVFPTTLLTLPAFVVAVVPPLVWTAVAA